MNANHLRDAFVRALGQLHARKHAQARGARMKIFLLRANISQKDLAEDLGLHKSTISLLLSGTLRLDTRLDQIAERLQITRRKLDSLIAANGGKKARAA